MIELYQDHCKIKVKGSFRKNGRPAMVFTKDSMEGSVIYIDEDQLDQVEYLITQSIQGNHVLFDSKQIKKVLTGTQNHGFNDEEAYSVEHHIETVLAKPTLGEKRAYLEKLDDETLDRVIRTYFNIIENNVLENLKERH